MKSPMIKMAMPMPMGASAQAAQAAFPATALFAHHAPSIQKPGAESAKMMRPHGGKGPHNPGEK